MHRHATPPPFHATAARESDRLDRKLSADAAKSLLNRIERMRREEEIRELRSQLEELRWRRGVVRTDAERRAIDALIPRCEAYIARATGEGRAA
jgi:hypothetical protein